MRFGSPYGSGFSITAFTTLKMVVFAPMASATVNTTAAVNSGVRRIMRIAYLTSVNSKLNPPRASAAHSQIAHNHTLSSRLLHFYCHPEPGRPVLANGGEGSASVSSPSFIAGCPILLALTQEGNVFCEGWGFPPFTRHTQGPASAFR